ncbi:MAG: LysE family translocator [Candidatus Methanoperedens sp.]|nr:LysE family translocator [Candidatus Methanoperedens sp.]
MTILEMLFIGFTVGLTGAMAPGPMLFATIESSLRDGWTAGPKIVFGHAILEIAICAFIVIGLVSVVNYETTGAISLIGGISLCIFGGLILRDRKNARLDTGKRSQSAGPVIAGFVTSASNPYFWIWWFSAGSGLIMEGLKAGLIAVGFFVAGHWIADAGWYTLVSASVSRSKAFMSQEAYRYLLTACGLFLVIFGLWFIARQFI